MSNLVDVVVFGLPTNPKAQYLITVFHSFIMLYSFAILSEPCPAICLKKDGDEKHTAFMLKWSF